MTADLNQKIYVAGHGGMVGSAIVRALQAKGYQKIIMRSREQMDLTNQAAVADFFLTERPDQVFMAAARVGGIYANNNFPAEFIYDNLMVQNNVIHQAFKSGVRKLLFLGSSCIYPKLAKQPITEDLLMTGKLEPTNEPYAIAKIAGIKMCESYNRQYGLSHGLDYRSVMPTNLYGPGDNYHPENSHVIPALIRRFHEAKVANAREVKIWGTGTPRREFLYVDDMAAASIFIMELGKASYSQRTLPMQNHLNLGAGSDILISDLAKLVADAIGFRGEIVFDASKPDGPPRKWLDSARLNELGWMPTVDLSTGLRHSYDDFLARHKVSDLTHMII